MVQDYLKDIRRLSALTRKKQWAHLRLYDYPFDEQLLTLSRLYRSSREKFLDLGGVFQPRMSSTMRSLSSQDLFADSIDYSPAETELLWFANHVRDVYSPDDEVAALEYFTTLSVFHEQNHRILWRELPAAPRDEFAFRRYLNFAESLVVTLDLALADQIPARSADAFERMKVIYRTGSASKKARSVYGDYLCACFFATYLLLELVNPEDILAALNYVRPQSRGINREAVRRALDMNELFTRVTNPQWQEREWRAAQKKLSKIHGPSNRDVLLIGSDPLDFSDDHFRLVSDTLKSFGLASKVSFS